MSVCDLLESDVDSLQASRIASQVRSKYGVTPLVSPPAYATAEVQWERRLVDRLSFLFPQPSTLFPSFPREHHERMPWNIFTMKRSDSIIDSIFTMKRSDSIIDSIFTMKRSDSKIDSIFTMKRSDSMIDFRYFFNLEGKDKSK